MTEINVKKDELEMKNTEVENNDGEEVVVIIEYKNHFTVTEYYSIVDELVNGFFDEDGEYSPQIGDMVSMLIFYNECIINKDSITEKGQPIDDLEEADVLFSDNNFIGCYNEAIEYTGYIAYDFANALKTALEIVNHRINSVPRVMIAIFSEFYETLNKINTLMTPDNIKLLSEFAKNVSDSNFNAQSVSDAFMTTEAYKRIMESAKENEDDSESVEEE